MKLVSFQVEKFRNIVDSNLIKVEPSVTCLVGKNEAGKSALLEALYLLHPAYDEKFNHEDQYPRWLVVQDRKAGDLLQHCPIKANFELEDKDIELITELFGEDISLEKAITVKRSYGNERHWTIICDEAKVIQNLISNFPSTIKNAFKKAKNLSELKKILEAEKKAADITPEKTQELNTVTQIINEKGLEKENINKVISTNLFPELPIFFRFSSYSTLPGRIDFKLITNKEDGPARSDLQTVRALLKLAGTDWKQLSNDDYELRKGELEAVQIDLTNQVFEYWKSNPYLQVHIDIDKETVNNNNGTTAVASSWCKTQRKSVEQSD